jgi:hypothetical protein
VSRSRSNLGAVAADMRGGDSRRLIGGPLKKGAHGGNMVSPVLNIPPEEVIPLETLRLGLRGDTLKEVLLDGERAPAT